MQTMLTDIHAAALRFLQPQTPLETYKVIVDESVKIIDGKFGNIMLENDGKLEKVYASIPSMQVLQTSKGTNTYNSFKHNRVIMTDSTFYIPLSYDSQVLGVLKIHTKQSSNSSKNLNNALRLLGSFSALAIKKCQIINEVNKTLEVRDFFIALVSHQLKTPLTTINGYMQRLKSREGKTRGQHNTWLKHLAVETGKLNHLVEQLIEVNKIRAGKLQYALQYCYAKDIVFNAVQEIQDKYPSRKIEIIGKLLNDGMIVDTQKVQKVLVGVLDNALKFSQNNTSVDVDLKSKNNKIHIVITDRGRGIDQQDIPYVMNGFYNPSYKEEKGLILGLFIAQKIVKDNKGTITLTSKKGKGTQVDIAFPRSRM